MAEPLRDWRRRKPGAVEHRHTEHTRELVKQEERLPLEAVEVIQMMGTGALEMKREIDELKRALEMIASHNVDQLRAVLDRVEAVHQASVEADNHLVEALRGLVKQAGGSK